MQRLRLLLLLFLPLATQAQVDLTTVEAGVLDGGKMWLFEDPPTDYLEATYGFRPDEAWYERAKLASLRMPGCSASFVSPNGLVATNHHCGEGSVIKVSQPGEGLLENGFYSQGLDEERPVEDLYMDQLVDIADVTDDVTALIDASGAQTDAEAADASNSAVEAIQERMQADLGGENADRVVQVVALYNGGRYSAYTYRRYTDVRLVMAPELRLGYFGGDFDNFTYPRYALDFSFFRIYGDDGLPLNSENYFPLSTEGVSEDALIFVIGNPGSTSRGLTVAQLETTRDILNPTILQFLDERVETLEAYLDEGPENPDAVWGQLFGLRNSQKAYRGRRAALADEYIMARRAAAERDFRLANEEAGELIDAMAEIQIQHRGMANETRAFRLLFNRRYGSALLLRARAAFEAEQQGVEDPDYGAVLEVDDRPASVELGYLTSEISALRNYFNSSDQPMPDVLVGADAATVARSLLANSSLSSAASAEAAVTAVSLSGADPAIQLVAAIMQDLQGYVSASRGLGAREDELERRLGEERFLTYGASVPPDATFSLRFTDGIVKGYLYNGTVAPYHTTLFGLYDHHYSYGANSDWGLPRRWLDAANQIDMSTPVNFTSTSDTIGGNSGSPAVNQNLELVGLNFDRTIEGLLRDYIYLPDRGRNVMVDVRVILEALQNVYGMDELVDELTTGELVH